VYLVNKKITSNHCQVQAQYYATAITPWAYPGGAWAMVPKMYHFHNLSPILSIFSKRSYYGWV